VKRVSTRVLVVTGLLVALLMAGVVSYYASSSPDGLNRVAQDKGFSGTQRKHVTDSPFAGYDTKGVANHRLSGGVAGVTGSLVVLVLAGGLALVVRRRGSRDGAAAGHQPAEHGGS
jgi:cobalt/nickel transport system permease protein/cobalt/nickel transport protein